MILSIDFGTSSLKLAVLDDAFAIVRSEKEAYPYIILPGEKVEIDPDALLSALARACMRLPETLRERVDLVCYDAFSPSLMLMDAEGAALYPVVTHMDRRSREQSETICRVMGKERYQSIAGVYPFTGGVSLTTLLWFRQHEPELCQSVHKIGHLTTFLHKYLTGVWSVDFVNASMMGLYDTVRQSGWSDEILSAFDIPMAWLPPIHMPGETLGALRPAAAEPLGLRAGIPVALGTNDAIASQAGAGNSRSGQALNIAGSSDMISVLADKPAPHPGYYVRNAARAGLWQIYATTSGGFAVDWFLKEFCREMGEAEFYGEYLPGCAARALETPLAFDPYLAEDRQSLEHKKAAWHGLSLASTREEMLSALLFGMQKTLRDVLDLAAAHTTMDGTLRITGGFAPTVMPLKRAMFAGYALDFRDDCALLGNAVLAAGE